MKRIIKFFSSVKLAIILLICLAFTSIIGTVIAQKQNPVLYIQHYGQGLYNFFKFMGFFDVYHSWWYIALLILLAINILFCSLRRLPGDLKRMDPQYGKDKPKDSKFSKGKVFHSTVPACRDTFISLLRKNSLGAPKETTEETGGLRMFFEKNRHGWVNFYLTHLSILIILLGGILSAGLGIKGYVQIPEGQSTDKFFEYPSNAPHPLGFVVRCDAFEIEYYANTQRPKDYRSHLTVLDEGKEVTSKVIEVNKPLTYKGITLYQSSYGEDPQSGDLVIQVKPLEDSSKDPVQEFRVNPGGSFEFTGSDGIKRRITVRQFLPDFGMDAQGKAFSKSNQMKNPAVQLLVAKGDESPFAVWSFQMFPDFQMIKRGDYMYTLKGYQGTMYTGLQVGRDPGVWVVWLGCILLMAGVILVLFSSHQRVWITLTPSPQGCSAHMMGRADKNKIGFEKKFNDIWQGMCDSFEQKPHNIDVRIS
ncbi:MAG: cytochrome c biogenesis protein ResB [bacterium]